MICVKYIFPTTYSLISFKNINAYVHIPTDNVYSVNRRARTSKLDLELFKANIYHEGKLTMQGYSEGLGKTRRS